MINKYQLKNKLVLINSENLLQQIYFVESVIEAGGRPILIGSNMNMIADKVEKIDKKYKKEISEDS